MFVKNKSMCVAQLDRALGYEGVGVRIFSRTSISLVVREQKHPFEGVLYNREFQGISYYTKCTNVPLMGTRANRNPEHILYSVYDSPELTFYRMTDIIIGLSLSRQIALRFL